MYRFWDCGATLSVDGGAVGDGTHAIQGVAHFWIHGACGYIHPKSRFDMDDISVRFVASSSIDVSYISDSLQVRNAVEKDVRLVFRSTIGDIAQWLGEG